MNSLVSQGGPAHDRHQLEGNRCLADGSDDVVFRYVFPGQVFLSEIVIHIGENLDHFFPRGLGCGKNIGRNVGKLKCDAQGAVIPGYGPASNQVDDAAERILLSPGYLDGQR
ncbi:MAG: hypothetical protein CSYNP_04402 [Syntrophus sp. SKADARSKE-3]|nr:hypothetical protein [Syntrophus sp. SKADARSKE-3]